MDANIYFKIILLLIAFILVKITYKTLIKRLIKRKDGFTPKIRQMYRPYLRTMNNGVETFTNSYNLTTLINKLRKWNIY